MGASRAVMKGNVLIEYEFEKFLICRLLKLKISKYSLGYEFNTELYIQNYFIASISSIVLH